MTVSIDKHRLRRAMRKVRSEHVQALPPSLAALMFKRPPTPVAELAPEGACVGLYYAIGAEAPTLAYARWFHENGRTVALPWFADRDSPMTFRTWRDPWDEAELITGPFGILQPSVSSPEAIPTLVFVPVLAFTAGGERLGQGGGHYDRWLAANPRAVALGLAWDCQLADALPTEHHDRPLRAVVTPTRLYEGTR
jgi:5-formyltetrahydrofolate cyclo-ligase